MIGRVRGWLRRLVGPESLDFFRHTRNYLSAGVLQKIVGAALFPILTGLLTPAEYGVLSIYASLVSLLTIVSMLNLHAGVSRYYLEDYDDFDRALGTHLLFLGAFNLVAVSAALIGAAPLAAWAGLSPNVFRWAVIVSAGSGLIEVHLSLLSAEQKSRHHSVLATVRSVLIAVGTVGVILLLDAERYLGRVYTDVAVTAAICTWSGWRLVRRAKLCWDPKYLRYGLRFSLPLIPHSMSRFALGYIDRIIILQTVGKAAAGLYSFAYDIGTAMSLVVLSMGKAWRPIFIREYAQGNVEKLDRMARDYARQIYLAAAVLILFAGDAVRLIIREAYHEGLRIVPVVVVGYVFVFLYTLFFQYSSFRRRTELISVYTVIAAVVNIGLNYWLVPIYGMEAAAWTTLASYALLAVLHYVNARWVLGERVLRLRVLLPGLAVVMAVAAAAMVLERTMGSSWASLGVRVGVLALAALLLWRRGLAAPTSQPEQGE